MKRTITQCFFFGIIAASFMLYSCSKDESGPVVNNNLFSTVMLVTTGGSFIYPSTAVPDATGQFLYFLATDSNTNGTGVFKVPAAGGPATEVFVGAPFNKPTDLALGTDNQTLFITDQATGIFAMGINGSVPVLVPGTAGTEPVALDVIQRSGQDQIYFCGTNPGDGKKAVFEIGSGGAGSPILRYKGTPLVSPSGIVSAADGTLFIADGGGKVHKLSTSGAMTEIASGIIMGIPAGIALTPDDKTVAISSKSPANGTAQVQLIELATGSRSIFNKVIGANSNPGGLHAARNGAGATGRYAWADVSRGGRVYRVDP